MTKKLGGRIKLSCKGQHWWYTLNDCPAFPMDLRFYFKSDPFIKSVIIKGRMGTNLKKNETFGKTQFFVCFNIVQIGQSQR